MASMFTSVDIAALVAAFPPAIPTKDRPSLLRSLSGTNLLNSQKVLDRFRTLLQTEPNRIKLSELSSLLQIKDISWLFDCFEEPIRFSPDKNSILTTLEFEAIFNKLKSESTNSFIELRSFAGHQDIALEDIREAVLNDPTLYHFRNPHTPGSTLVSSSEHAESVKHELLRIVEGAASEKIDLTEQLPLVPVLVIRDLFNDIQDRDKEVNGHIEEQRTGLVFVPASYSLAQNAKQKEAHASAVRDLMQSLREQGFCVLSTDDNDRRIKLHDDVVSELSEGQQQLELRISSFNSNEGYEVIVRQEILQEIQEGLKKDLKTLADTASLSSDSRIDSTLEAALIERSSNPELAGLMLRSPHRKDIEDSFSSLLLEVERTQFLELQTLFQKTVAAPLQLYTAGIAEEPTLRQHQEEFLLDHFRSEVIPRFAESARKHDRNARSKLRLKDVEKLVQQSSQSRTLSDAQTVVDKFAKKQAIQQPDDSLIHLVKRETLRQKAIAVQKMSRPSDVLQNLIWILLAQRSEGLFMSAGKDTSRMIKQYQLLGDRQIGEKLEAWRDLLKSGRDSEEAVLRMRELATNVVKAMYEDKGDAVSQ